MVAFCVLGIASFAALALSMLWQIDMIQAVSPLLPKFIYLFNGDDQRALIEWLPTGVEAFNQARGNLALDPVAWMNFLVIGSILVLAHSRRFRAPTGEHLLQSPKAGAVVRLMLHRFGYFSDICISSPKSGERNTDFFASGTLFFTPKAHVTRLLKGKASSLQQKVLEFFMAHEYAHAATRDNLAHSVFMVVLALLLFMFFMSFGPLIAYGAAFIAQTPMGPGAAGPISLAILLPLYSGIYLSFRGMVVSYIKAREFFADQAAFRFVPDVDTPYGSLSERRRPDLSSALRVRISLFERLLHKDGESLHARDVLVYFWGFILSIRTLFVLTAPKDICWTVLMLDGLALGSFACLWVTLPKRPKDAKGINGTAWFLTFLTISAVEFCGMGLVGAAFNLDHSLFSNFNAQLVGLPGFILFFVFFIGCLVLVIRRLLGWRRLARAKGAFFRRFGLVLLVVPGLTMEGMMIVVVGLLFCLVPINFYLRLEFLKVDVAFSAGLAVTFIVGSLLLYYQYQLLFVRTISKYFTVGLIEGILFMALMSNVYIVYADALSGVRERSIHSVFEFDKLLGLFAAADWSSVLPFAIISTCCYLVLRLVAFWAQGEMARLDQRLARESSR
nr:M48 family metalloprotease [uncultured Cohaesibacter sp.]